MTLKLTKVFRTTEDKEGNPLIFKSGPNQGKPYTKLLVKAEEYGDRWISGFSDEWNEMWEEGDEVNAGVEENGQYLNLKKPSANTELAEQVKDLTERVVALEAFIQDGADSSEDVDISDIPA